MPMRQRKYHSSPAMLMDSRSPTTVQQKRHRPIIQEFHLHMSTEHTCFHLHSGRAKASHRLLIPSPRLVRRGRVIEPRATPLCGITKQRELRHEQDRAADLSQRSVHFSLLIGKDPERMKLVDYVQQITLLVAFGYTQQHQETDTNTADGVSLYLDGGSCHTLNNCLHGNRPAL
ncbi:hypothetical protein NSPZN2_11307 [Nitrospira defluvii]|uniref:Uncharacterized protein n=1 Tax=Nitrospira defluvii TaxID=330214 RepID=A0ABM8QSH7_9BACT|nr:hypothetical protein NSPZN2_11307 [Nitrospira defluvii]